MALDVVIVGAGIAGLSTAISLRRAGHHVRIYERSALNNEVGAAINVPPNASRALLAWGLDPAASGFVTVQSLVTGIGSSMEQLSFTPLGDWVAKVYGAPFYFAHRVDLHEALKELATGKGVGEPAVIHLKSLVVAYVRLLFSDLDPETPSITLSTGEVVAADLVVAADGIHSLGIESVLGKPNPPQPQELYNGCYRFLIPAADLDADPETAVWNQDHSRDGRMSIYMNGKTGNRFVSYPCRNNQVWNFVGLFHDDDLKSATQEDWHAPVSKAHLLASFPSFHPLLLSILNKATDVKRWPLLYRAPIPTWTKSHLVILGDAAHPMLPHQGQGGAQSIEDGIALGIALCGAAPGGIAARLGVFERARRDRASAIQVLSNAAGEQVGLVEREAGRFVEVVPRTPLEFARFNWGFDVVRTTVDLVREVEGGFELPQGFFGGDAYLPKGRE
ncbi:hypothetical protein B0T25DRAFT_602022 [Lasiosphaeria hispida]|uniref:Salicylate hydroxylase n=1 Tax=Lasiosphaeria hispida TaxID=260671 RepID=A0AAJ0MIW1_9PEZI|nr:hypothetical protein B0T25DRAFT_602022 [Lasiosphaeria hispida]